MTLSTFLYVSTVCIASDRVEAELSRLVDHAALANRQRSVTGALMMCGPRFVQLLEGPLEQLDLLAERISADDRHSDVFFLFRRSLEERRFRRFGLVYSGPSLFVSRSIALPVAQAKRGSEPSTDDLVELMIKFAED